jgi:predicted transcriptional regulator
MPKTATLKLTPGELEILELLWTEGPVNLTRTRTWFHERGRNLAVTTVHTRLNRLVDKGIVRRIDAPPHKRGPALYEAAIGRDEVANRYAELVTELCGRNWIPMVAGLAETRDFTSEEIDFLERLIKKQKTKEKK